MYIVVINDKHYGPYTMQQVADLKKAGTLTQYKAKVFKARTKPQATAAPAPLVMPEPTKVAAPAQPITGHVTTERTGKRHKLNRVYAWSMLAVSVLMLVLVGSISSGNDSPSVMGGLFALFGLLGLMASCVWLYIIKWQVWWHHG